VVSGCVRVVVPPFTFVMDNVTNDGVETQSSGVNNSTYSGRVGAGVMTLPSEGPLRINHTHGGTGQSLEERPHTIKLQVKWTASTTHTRAREPPKQQH
jgi:hypothetical protein